MKIRIIQADGITQELLTLVGTWEIKTNSDSDYGCLYNKELGVKHFFAADGTYDGYEFEVEASFQAAEDATNFIKGFHSAIEADREIVPPKNDPS